MNTAVLIGQGPEVTALLARADRLPKGLILFETNLSRVRKHVRFPLVNLFNTTSAPTMLAAQEVSRVVAVGTLRPANPRVKGAEIEQLKRLLREITIAKNANDGTRIYIHSLLRPKLKFPAVRSVLPFLFARKTVGINPKPDLLAKTLQQHGRSGGCHTVTVSEESIGIFRSRAGEPSTLFNCCLFPEKLEQLHRNKSVKVFFFDRRCTILVEYKRMAVYARKNKLTLQSFN